MRLPALISVCLLGAAVSSVRAADRSVTGPVRKKEQQFEQEVKTERDRPHKKERAKAAVGRVEDGVREFGRGLNGVMKEAGIGDGPAPAAKKSGPKAAPAKPAPKAAAKKPAPAATPPAAAK